MRRRSLLFDISLQRLMLHQECSSLCGVGFEGILRSIQVLEKPFAVAEKWITLKIHHDEITPVLNSRAESLPVQLNQGQMTYVLEVLISPFFNGENPRNHWSGIEFLNQGKWLLRYTAALTTSATSATSTTASARAATTVASTFEFAASLLILFAFRSATSVAVWVLG